MECSPLQRKFSKPDLACVTPWKLLKSLELECGGGLLLLRHVTPLTRRDVIYFYSGAHILGRRPFAWRFLAARCLKKKVSQRQLITLHNEPAGVLP